MKRNDCFFIIILILFINVASCGKPYGIQFDKEIYNFGVVEEGTEVIITYTFKNIGKERVTIKFVQPSCACTKALPWDKTVGPGEKGKIPITFTAPSVNGEIIKAIVVKTDIPEQESIRLIIKGKIIIPIEIIPLSFWLGEVNTETKSLSGSFKIRNNLDSPLKIIEIIPPDINIEYTFSIIKEDQQYKVDYTLYPPFEGIDKVGKQFTLKTNNKKKEYLYPKFFYVNLPIEEYSDKD